MTLSKIGNMKTKKWDFFSFHNFFLFSFYFFRQKDDKLQTFKELKEKGSVMKNLKTFFLLWVSTKALKIVSFEENVVHISQPLPIYLKNFFISLYNFLLKKEFT